MNRFSSDALFRLAALGLCFLASVSCSQPSASETKTGPAAETKTGPTAATKSDSASPPAETPQKPNLDFALALYRQMAESNAAENLAASPASVSVALAMTYAGAAGETKAQMARTLGFLPDAEKNSALFGRLQTGWTSGDSADAGYQLSVANRIWARQDLPVRESFAKATREHFGAELALADFGAAPAQVRGQINAWVAEKTADMISELLPSSAVDAQTIMILVNAIYFKAFWARQFEPSNTRSEPFHLLDGSSVEVPMMSQTGDFRYWRDASLGVQALELPYQGGSGAAMLALLPESPAGLAKLEAALTPERLETWSANLRQQKAKVSLPRFKASQKLELSDALIALGMPDAFSGQADFSGIFASGGAQISKVIHEAVVEVDEQGTKAAAATAVTMRAPSASPVAEFRADRPFLFFIRDGAGNILFMGRVANPAL
jgi:serpin B